MIIPESTIKPFGVIGIPQSLMGPQLIAAILTTIFKRVDAMRTSVYNKTKLFEQEVFSVFGQTLENFGIEEMRVISTNNIHNLAGILIGRRYHIEYIIGSGPLHVEEFNFGYANVVP